MSADLTRLNEESKLQVFSLPFYPTILEAEKSLF